MPVISARPGPSDMSSMIGLGAGRNQPKQNGRGWRTAPVRMGTRLKIAGRSPVRLTLLFLLILLRRLGRRRWGRRRGRFGRGAGHAELGRLRRRHADLALLHALLVA